MNILFALLRWLLFGSTRPYAEIEVARAALDEGSLTLIGKKEEKSVPGLIRWHFDNGRMSIHYFQSDQPDGLHETIDYAIRGYTGGYYISFTEGNIVMFNRVGGRLRPAEMMSAQNVAHATKILLAAREAYVQQHTKDVPLERL